MSDIKSLLITPHYTTEDVVLPVATITVRALSRLEILEQRKGLKGVKSEQAARDKAFEGDWELWMVSTAMVNPIMTKEDVKLWQAASPAGEIEGVTEVIMRLSGIGKTRDPNTGTEDSADKAAYKSIPE
jgi:hypothetical protein